LTTPDQPADPEQGSPAEPIMGRTPDRILGWVEFAFIMGFANWTAFGMIHYFITSGGTLEGLLTMLDTKWKGLLILGAILFFRSLQPSLMKMKLKTPVGDVDMSNFAVLPAASYQNPPATYESAPSTTEGTKKSEGEG
jgi:hypothetical protein